MDTQDRQHSGDAKIWHRFVEIAQAAGNIIYAKYVSIRGDISDANPLPVSQNRILVAAADVHTPVANTAAVVTYAADATKKHVITGVAWSYSGGLPVGGNIKIEDVSGTIIFSLDITEQGPGSFEFPRPKIGRAVNTAMIITLAAGGVGVTGRISILNHWLEA